MALDRTEGEVKRAATPVPRDGRRFERVGLIGVWPAGSLDLHQGRRRLFFDLDRDQAGAWSPSSLLVVSEDGERVASFHLLHPGSVGERVSSTVSLIVDGDRRIVIDPGMVATPAAILDPLEGCGVSPRAVTDVVISHHHPDHTMNIALFPDARVHDHWAIYHHDRWTSRPADGFEVSPSVRLAATPGHTPQDITTLVGTPDGLYAFTHLWWFEGGPGKDPYATDRTALDSWRTAVTAVADVVVPGHGPPFPLRGS